MGQIDSCLALYLKRDLLGAGRADIQLHVLICLAEYLFVSNLHAHRQFVVLIALEYSVVYSIARDIVCGSLEF